MIEILLFLFVMNCLTEYVFFPILFYFVSRDVMILSFVFLFAKANFSAFFNIFIHFTLVVISSSFPVSVSFEACTYNHDNHNPVSTVRCNHRYRALCNMDYIFISTNAPSILQSDYRLFLINKKDLVNW